MNRVEFTQVCTDVQALSLASPIEQQAKALDRLYRVLATRKPAEQKVALKVFNEALGRLRPQQILEGGEEGDLVGLVEPLSAHGADLNAAVLNAAEKGFLSLMRSLKAAGADLNSERADGATPFVLAEINQHKELAAFIAYNA